MPLPRFVPGALVAATVAALVTSIAAVPAVASPTWLPPGDIGARSSNLPEQPAVDVTASGVAAAVWTDPVAPTTGVVRLAHGAGGAFAPSQVVSGNEGMANTGTYEPLVALAADGSGVVAWLFRNNTQYQVRYRTFAANGALGPIVDETPLAPVSLSYLSLDVNATGRMGLAWIGDTTPYGAVGSLSGGLSPGAALNAPADGAYSTQVGLDAAGDAVFAWERDFTPGTGRYQVEARVQPAGAAMLPVTVLDGAVDDQRAEYPSLSVGADGRAVVAYGYRPTQAGAQITRSAVRTVTGGFAGGTWSPVADVSTIGQLTSSDSARPAMLPDGTAIVTYEDGTTGFLWAASRPIGGSFGGHQALDNVDGGQAAIGVGAGGTVVAVVADDTGVNGTLMAAIRPVGATQFAGTNPAVDTMTVGWLDDPSVAVDDQGNAYAVSVGIRCVVATSPCPGGVYNYAVRAVVLDGAGPAVTDPGIPAFAVVKRKTAFVATAADRLSTTTVGWSFGDGGTASGPSVKHTFKKKGTFTVTMTATDGHGTSTTRTGKVQVLAPALSSKLSSRFKAGKKATEVTKLELKKLVPGAKVVVTCKGKGCPTKSKSFTITKKGGLSLTGLFTTPTAQLKPGVTLLVKVTAKKATGVYFSFTMVKGKAPEKEHGCLGPKGQQFAC